MLAAASRKSQSSSKAFKFVVRRPESFTIASFDVDRLNVVTGKLLGSKPPSTSLTGEPFRVDEEDFTGLAERGVATLIAFCLSYGPGPIPG